MNRREFTTGLGLGALAFGLGGIKLSSALPEKTHRREIAITMDDFNWNKSVKINAGRTQSGDSRRAEIARWFESRAVCHRAIC